MAASLSDILTSAQNIATGLNLVAHTMIDIAGAQNMAGITAATLVKSGPGRIATVSVIVAGSSVGYVYDTNDVTSTARPLYNIAASAFREFINMPFSYGLVIVPGTGQTVSVSYS